MQVIAAVAYLALAILQIAATLAGFEEFGLSGFIAFILAIVFGVLPLVGTGFGVYGAVVAWGWSWPVALGLFFSPIFLIGILAVAVAAIAAFESMRTQRRRLGSRKTASSPKHNDIIVPKASRASQSDDATFLEEPPRTAIPTAHAEAKHISPLLLPVPSYQRAERTRARKGGASKYGRLCAYLACFLLFAAGISVGAFFSVPIMASVGLGDGLNAPGSTATILPDPALSSNTSSLAASDTTPERREPVASTTQEAHFQQPLVSCDTTLDTTLDMIVCMNGSYQQADRDLNKTYNDLMKRLADFDDDFKALTHTPNSRTLLRDAQRAWIAFRDKECELAYWSGGGGTIAPILRLSCLADLTEKRIAELRASANDRE